MLRESYIWRLCILFTLYLKLDVALFLLQEIIKSTDYASIYEHILKGVIAYVRPQTPLIGFICERDAWHELPAVK